MKQFWRELQEVLVVGNEGYVQHKKSWQRAYISSEEDRSGGLGLDYSFQLWWTFKRKEVDLLSDWTRLSKKMCGEVLHRWNGLELRGKSIALALGDAMRHGHGPNTVTITCMCGEYGCCCGRRQWVASQERHGKEPGWCAQCRASLQMAHFFLKLGAAEDMHHSRGGVATSLMFGSRQHAARMVIRRRS